MAGRKTTTAVVKKTAPVKSTRKSSTEQTFADYFRFGESYTSLVLGIVVVIFASLLLITLLRSRGNNSHPAIQETSSIATQKEEGKTEAFSTDGKDTYVIQKGDDLWKIAQDQYNDGYRWPEIAKANNLSNPSIINVGTKLVIPHITKSNLADNKKSDATSNVAMDNATPTVVATVTPTLTPIPTKAVMTKMESKPTPILPPKNNLEAGPKIAGNTYTVVAGDYLWEIAERAYGDPYKWVEIAKANNLSNPDLIYVGTTLSLPR